MAATVRPAARSRIVTERGNCSLEQDGCRPANAPCPLTPSSVAKASKSNGFSAGCNTSGPSPPEMTSASTTLSSQYNSQLSEQACGQMSRSPGGRQRERGGRRDGIAPSGRRPLAARSEWRLSPRSGLRDISAGFRGRSARGKGRGGLRQAPVRTGALMSDVARPGRSPVDGTTGQKRDRPCRSPTAGSAPPTRRL